MFEAPRLAVMIALALMTVGAVWACVNGGPVRAGARTGAGAQEISVQDALRAVLREAAVSGDDSTETDGIVPAAALPAGSGTAMMQFIAIPVQAIGALRPHAPEMARPAARGPPPAV